MVVTWAQTLEAGQSEADYHVLYVNYISVKLGVKRNEVEIWVREGPQEPSCLRLRL